jgi:NADH-ubiquinone oxidoreductase chain 4
MVTLAALGMILGAAYSLWLYNCVIFGNFKPKFLENFSDLNRREAHVKDLRRIFGTQWALLCSSS